MRVLLVSHLALPHIGGVEVLVDREIRALVAAGHAVAFVTSDGVGQAQTPVYPASVRVVRVKAWHGLERRFRLPYPLFSPALVGILWRETGWADIVHVHGFMFVNTALALVLGRLRGRPTILTDHGGIQRFDSRVTTLLARAGVETVGRLSARLANRLVSYNMRVVRLLERLAGRPAHFLPNPVDWGLFSPPSPGARASAQEALGWTDGRPRVLFVGRLTPDKGVPVLLDARDPSYDLVFCGPGDPAILGPLPRPGVEYLPPRPQPDLVRVYHAADLLVLSTNVREGFPVVAQEALACGLPVVMTYEEGYEPYRRLAGLAFCERAPAAIRSAILERLRVGTPSPDPASLRDFCPSPEAWLRTLYEGL